MSDVETPAPADADEDVPQKRKRPRWFLPVVIGAPVLVVLAAGSIVAAVAFSAPHAFTAKGSVLLAGADCTSIPAGFDDINQGAGVTIKDPSGKVVAVGELGGGKDIGDGLGCSFTFSVKDVPSGLGIYGVEVSHRGLLQYKEAVLKRDGAEMSLTAQ